MTVDVLVTTFRRARTLERTIESLMSAPVPPTLEVRVTIVQNDNDPDTTRVLDAAARQYQGRLIWVHEPVNGKAHALNTGIRSTHGELIGIVDDDEEIGSTWYEAIATAFETPGVDFISGPCLPRWGAVPPGWLPDSWHGVIGFVDLGDRTVPFTVGGEAIMMGGNAVIRREALVRVGLFSSTLGPRARHRLFSCEDQDVHDRLLAAGATGLYVPALRVYHFVPSQRLTKSYYRRWSFWNGVSRSVLDALRPSPVSRIGRVPRYLIGSALRGLVRGARAVHRDPAIVFEGQLAVLHVLGFLYGSYWYRRESR